MEGDVVLAHELDVADIVGAGVGAPPPAPVARLAVLGVLGPFLGRGDVFDRRVEPDVEHLVLEARARQPAPRHRHAPGQVAGDAPVDQALVQVLVGDRARQGRPVGLGVDEAADLLFQLGLQQVEVAGVAHLDVLRARDRRIGLDQVGGVEQPAAVVALVTARRGEAAVRAGPLHIAVGQEAPVVDRIDHPVGALLDQAAILQHFGEMLGQAVVLRRGRAAEPVPRQAVGAAHVVLQGVLLVAIGGHVLPRRGGGQLGRRAVLVGGADVEHLVPARPLEAGEHVGRQHRARQVAQVLDAVDVGQGRGDEDAGHGLWVCWTGTGPYKRPARKAKGRTWGSMPSPRAQVGASR